MADSLGPLNRRLEAKATKLGPPHGFPSELREEPLAEGVFDVGYADPDTRLTAAQMGSAYVRRLTQSTRDLPAVTFERGREIAYYLFETNPLAKHILELIKDFVIGEGITCTATGEDETLRDKVQDVIDEFWTDPINDFENKLHKKILQIGLWGEQVYPVFVNPVDGSVRLGYLDPADVAEIIHHPENAELPIAVVTKSVPVWPKGSPVAPTVVAPALSEQRRYRVIHVDEDPNSEWFGRLVGARTDTSGEIIEEYLPAPNALPQKYAGSCFVFTINNVSNATRGRSDLLCLADWIDSYDQLLFNEIDRSLLMKNFIWDVTLTGADDNKVLEFMKRYGTAPNPGAIRFHNEQVTWNAVTPDLKSQDATQNADLILSLIATGAGAPKTWMNGTMDVNRATAVEVGVPGFKRLAARQKYVLGMIRQLVTYALDEAEKHGRIPRRQPKGGDKSSNLIAFRRAAASTVPPDPADNDDGPPVQVTDGGAKQVEYGPSNPAYLAPRGAGLKPEAWDFSVNAPELLQKDIQSHAQTLKAAAEALELLRAGGAIDLQVEQDAIALLMGQFGVEIDLEAMRERLEQEKAAEPTMTTMDVAQMIKNFAGPKAQPAQNEGEGGAVVGNVSEAPRIGPTVEDVIRRLEEIGHHPDPAFTVEKTVERDDDGNIVGVTERHVPAVRL